jgi:hypothetical protein
MLLDALLFLPLATAVTLAIMMHGRSLSAGALAREGLAYLGWGGPLALGYGAVRAFEAIRLLPRYSGGPPPPRDPMLERPYWGVLAGVVIVVAAAAVLIYLARRAAARVLPEPGFESSRTVLLGVMLVLSALGLLYNTFWAAAFFAVPALVWPLVGRGKGTGRRVANRIVIAAAGAPWYFMTAIVALALGVGWKVLWFEVLAMSTGMFRPAGVVLAIGVIATGARLVAIQVAERDSS